MTAFPPAWVPLGILFVAGGSSTWRVMQLKKRGVNAVVVQGGSDLHALLERLFGTIVVGTTLFCVAFAVHRSIAAQLGDIGLLEVPALAWCGVFLGAGGATLVAFAQFDMGASWRIGVPRNEANPLVTQSLYRVSRNPIYLGMLIALAGIFLIAPNAVTLALMMGGWIVMSAQIRIEEEFLSSVHGPAFAAYRRTTRRWI